MNKESTISLIKNINTQAEQLERMFSVQGLNRQFSSARQMQNITQVLNQEAEEKAIKRRGAEAQIESSKVLVDQHEEMKIMREAINALLRHNLEQSKQQEDTLQERDEIETKRYRENNRLSKIAAWTGVIGSIIGIVSICLQLIF